MKRLRKSSAQEKNKEQKRSGVEPLDKQGITPPDFSDPSSSQNFIVAGERLLRRAVENASRRRMKEQVGTALHQPQLPPFDQGFSQIVSSF